VTSRTSAKHQFPIAIKEISGDGSFEGLLAVYGNVDLGKDMIEPGAFTKTIQEHGSEVPLLWQHDTDEPIGKLTLVDGPDALRVKGQLLMDLPMAQKAFLLLKARIIRGLSIGYDSIKDSVEEGVRHLKELRLWEGSIVTFPMNEAAMVTSVKRSGASQTKDDFDTELQQVQLQDAGYQMFCALRTALCSLNWDSVLSKDDKVTAAQTILDQFSLTYMAYLPLYLDYLNQEYGMQTMSRTLAERKDMKRIQRQLKEGRKFSSETMKSLKEAHGHVKAMDDIFAALFGDEADDETDDADQMEDNPDKENTGDEDTTEPKAAVRKTEPAVNHSAATQFLDDMRSLVPTA
jgi:HK97 family phage prohead protease